MINVTCTVKNQDPEKKAGTEEVEVTSLEHGFQMVAIVIGDNLAEVNGKELIAAVENCMNTR